MSAFARETPGLIYNTRRAEAHALRAQLHDAMESEDLALVRHVDGTYSTAIAARDEMLEAIEALLPHVEEDEFLDVETERRIADLQADIRAIRQGVEPDTGITCPPLEALRGLPGLVELEEARDHLAARIALLEARQNIVWPRTFKYVGPRFRHYLDTRYARPGDIVELDERQAALWSDRFEPVDTSEPVTSAPIEQEDASIAIE